MDEHVLTQEKIERFREYLILEEKSAATVEKYIRDVRAFSVFMGNLNVTKEGMMNYKKELVDRKYAICSINSMLASLNSMLDFLGWSECKVKHIKQQRITYCTEEKELTKGEYLRLLHAADNRPQLHLILETICSTGIRISELRFFTVEAAGVAASKVFPHNLRKLFARTFYNIEKDIAKLADILGHSSIDTTRIYIMTTSGEHRKKIERLGLVV